MTVVTTTTVLGLELVELLPYRVVLNGEMPVEWPAELAALAPEPGTLVAPGPVGVPMPFDPDNPVAVFVWLRGHTDVHRIEGPDLTPRTETVPGRIY